MPIYEYACEACGTTFEELIIRKSDEAELVCRGCKSKKITRLISRPAASPTGAGAGSSASGPSCGPIG